MVSIFNDSLMSTSDVSIWVEDTCTHEVLFPNSYSDQRKKLTLRLDEVRGRCLQMNIYGENVREDGVEVVSTDAYHSSDKWW